MIRFNSHHDENDPPRTEPIASIGSDLPVHEGTTPPGKTGDGGGDQPKRPRRRWRRYLLCAMLLVLLTGGGVFYMTRRPPQAWREYEHLVTQTTPQQRQETVKGVLRQLESALALEDLGLNIEPSAQGKTNNDRTATKPLEVLSAIDIAEIPLDRSTQITLSNEELSALVVHWFDEWVHQRGFDPPGGMQPPIIVVIDNKLQMAFEARHENWRQVFGGEIRLKFNDDGMAEGSVHNFTIGSLPVSLSRVGEALRDDLDAETAKEVGGWLGKLERFEFRPVLELENRRRARITHTLIGDETVTLTIRVQDHNTYKKHNQQMAAGQAVPTGALQPALPETGVADVPTDY